MTEKNNMLGFARKLLYRTASALERRSDENYYFVDSESKINYNHSPCDFLLCALARKSPAVAKKFHGLEDIAAGMGDPDFGVFRIFAAAKGAGVFDGVSDEGNEYLLLKAYRRGISFRAAREEKKEKAEFDLRIMRCFAMCLMRNSTYGSLSRVPSPEKQGAV